MQLLALYVGHLYVIRRITGNQQQERPFALRTTQYVVQKSHRARRVRQADKPGLVQGHNQNPGGQACRFDRVVVLYFAAIGQTTELLQKNNNQIRRRFQEGFVGVRPEWFERGQPFRRRAVFIKLLLLCFGSDPDAFFWSPPR